jgi:hypothetical protein
VTESFGPGFHVAPGRAVDMSAYDRWVGPWSRLFVPTVLRAAEVTPGCCVRRAAFRLRETRHQPESPSTTATICRVCCVGDQEFLDKLFRKKPDAERVSKPSAANMLAANTASDLCTKKITAESQPSDRTRKNSPAALAPRTGCTKRRPLPSSVKSSDCADLILSLRTSRFPRRRSRAPHWSLCPLPRCGSCRLHRLPPVRDHSDRDGGNPERHQSAGRAFKRFDLDGDDNESKDDTAAENKAIFV